MGRDHPLGYGGVWELIVNGDEIILEEQQGGCCICVPNPFPKKGFLRHRMVKEADNVWRGTLACKPISLTVVSENQLEHLTTDGYFVLTREPIMAGILHGKPQKDEMVKT